LLDSLLQEILNSLQKWGELNMAWRKFSEES